VGDYVAKPTTRSKSMPNDANHPAVLTGIDFQCSISGRPSKLAGGNTKSITIGLIDRHRLTQECLTKALSSLHPEIKISNFVAVRDCIDATPTNFDLIIYYPHGNDVSDTTVTQTIATISQVFPTTPVMIFSDADRTQQQTVMRSTLESGARAFVPMRTAGLLITSAAISFVNAGGTFVPADLMFPPPRGRTLKGENQLTSRQQAVFTQLRLGKVNKVIAHELGMSESTVKVHVRNIMRKVGATNRTQAAYRGERFSANFEGIKLA
jgi:DNA-binding NarL/FixJ family response regulator